tara:strand:+ start:17 stop:139 length:123 start_codon:yes stop_codon:yes gene_type:complete
MKDKGRICALILVAMFAILFLTGCSGMYFDKERAKIVKEF